MQSTYLPDIEEIWRDQWMEELDCENGKLPYYHYDYEFEDN